MRIPSREGLHGAAPRGPRRRRRGSAALGPTAVPRLPASRRWEQPVQLRQLVSIQAQRGGLPVVAQVGGVGRLRNCHHARPAQHPGQRQLCRGDTAARRQVGQIRMARQRALVDRRIGHQRHVLLALPRQQVELDAALLQRVPHLVAAAGRTARQLHQLLHVCQVEVADAPVTNQTTGAQLLETLHRVAKRHRATPVQQVKVDVLQPQPAQAALAGGRHALGAGVVRIDLGDDEELFACQRAAQGRSQRLAKQGFGAALAIHLGGVEEPIADVQRQAQCGQLGLVRGAAFAHAPGAQAQHRHYGAIRQARWTDGRVHAHDLRAMA